MFGSSLTDAEESDEDLSPPETPLARPKKRKKRWMSVAELVVEFETALARGVRIRSDDPTYANLREEARRLRAENDLVIAEMEDLNRERTELVKVEEAISLRLEQDFNFAEYGAEEIDALKKIRSIDFKAAALRCQQCQNVRDVGLLKRTMNRITSMGEVDALVDGIEGALQKGEHIAADGPELAAIDRLVQRFTNEYDNATTAVNSYREDVKQVIAVLTIKNEKIRESAGHDESQEIADVRWSLVQDLQQMKRMLAQLSRLREMQRLSAKELGLMQRTRTKVLRQAQVRSLVEKGDRQQLKAKLDVLRAETAQLRASIKNLEHNQSEHAEDSANITAELRALKEIVTPETGTLREKLLASINAEENMRARLAAMRGTKLQNLHFISMLNAALQKA